MKTESTAKFVTRLTVTLLLITSVVAALLALVDGVTAPRIAELNAQKTQQAIEAVLPGGGEEMAEGEYNNEGGKVSAVYQGENGYAVQVIPTGFNGTVTMMVGVDKSGSVLGISVVSQSETAGLGAVCAATTSAGEEFRSQFVGMSGSVSVTKDGGQVDAISSATITSRAVCDGINAALACVGAMG